MDLSFSSLVWLTSAVAVTLTVVFIVWKNGRPAPSITHVLYEVQPPADRPR